MKPDPLFMAYRDDDPEPSAGDVRPPDETLAATHSDANDGMDGDIDSTSPLDNAPLGNADPFEYAGDVYGATLRSISLLTGEEEESLGRTIQESRIRMTEFLARVPAAVSVFVQLIEQAGNRERPITDALFSPFGNFSELSDENVNGEKLNWRHAAHIARRLLGEWLALDAAATDSPERDAMRTRLAKLARDIQPGWVALREALRICEQFDDRVASVEAERGAFHADILSDSPRLEGHATLLRIQNQSGVDLTTLRECRLAAASAYARYTSARDRMVNANLRLAYFMAHRLRGNNLAFDDLVQEAIIGLMRAVDKFDYRMGYKFSTYAVQWIRQTTTRAIADSSRTIRVAAHVHDDIVRLRRLARELEQKLGREPSASELAKISGTPESKIQQYLRLARQSVSLDAPPADIEDSPLSTIIADSAVEDPRTSTHDTRLAGSVATILDALPDREAFILRLRHGVGGTEAHTLEEIGRMLGITRERTRQLEARAIKRLRETLEPDLLRGLDD